MCVEMHKKEGETERIVPEPFCSNLSERDGNESSSISSVHCFPSEYSFFFLFCLVLDIDFFRFPFVLTIRILMTCS